MIKVLAIGNSFSEDATRYLHGVAKAGGVDMKVVNLFIGGCPLSYHYSNILSDEKKYALMFNGENTGFCVSIKDALLSESRDGWDFITMQQVSGKSNNYDTYQPYLSKLSEYVRMYMPKTEQLIHQTWAYEEGGVRLTEELGYKCQKDMFSDVKNAYDMAAKSINARIIPSGETLQNLISEGKKVHRDGFHAEKGYTRFALSLTWYEMLTGKSALDIDFSDFDVPVDKNDAELAKKAAHKACQNYR